MHLADWTLDGNECRNYQSESPEDGVETAKGLEFQGVVVDLATCMKKCEDHDDCTAFEFYYEKRECTLGIAPKWKGLDLGAQDHSCFLKN